MPGSIGPDCTGVPAAVEIGGGLSVVDVTVADVTVADVTVVDASVGLAMSAVVGVGASVLCVAASLEHDASAVIATAAITPMMRFIATA